MAPTEPSHPNDASPYVDTSLMDDEDVRTIAMREVDDELEVYPPDKDYLEHLPPLNHRPFLTPLLKLELQSVEDKESREKSSRLAELPIDIPQLDGSSGDEQQVALWNKCLNQVKIKIEYQQRHLTNLEIIKSYSLEVWKLYLEEYEQIDMSLTKEIEDINKQSQQVDWTHKLAQEQIARTLDLLKKEWMIR